MVDLCEQFEVGVDNHEKCIFDGTREDYENIIHLHYYESLKL